MLNDFDKQYFARQLPILGEAAQARLASKKAAIIGAGGLGGFYALGLSGCGLGEIYVVDDDVVSLHNLHRQVMFGFDDVGTPKPRKYATLSARTHTKIHPQEQSAQEFFKQNTPLDIIIDATDNARAREQIRAGAAARGVPFVYTSVDGFSAQACLCSPASKLAFASGAVRGQVAPMVMLSASIGATLALRYLAGLQVQYDVLYHVDFGASLEIFNFTH